MCKLVCLSEGWMCMDLFVLVHKGQETTSSVIPQILSTSLSMARDLSPSWSSVSWLDHLSSLLHMHCLSPSLFSSSCIPNCISFPISILIPTPILISVSVCVPPFLHIPLSKMIFQLVKLHPESYWSGYFKVYKSMWKHTYHREQRRTLDGLFCNSPSSML